MKHAYIGTSSVIRSFVLLLALAATGCNLPRAGAAAPTPNVTQAYQTVQAHLTQAALLTPAQTAPPSPTAPPSSAPSPTSGTLKPTPTQKPPASATASSRLCDQAAPGVPIDVTVPDDTQFPPGQSFTKTWRLQNTGTCTWSRDYSIALFSGESMGAPPNVPVPGNVAPGQVMDISVDLVAPRAAGTYQGNWKLRNASGTWFGIGPNSNSPFWVKIVVVATVTGTPTLTSTPETPYPGPSGSPTPGVQVSGTTALVPGDKINLDTNQINLGSGEDLSYETNANNKLYLVPLGDARIALVGKSTPSYAECQAASLSNSALALKNLGQGQFICYRTDQGLYGWVRLLSLNDVDNTLGIQLLTWSQP
jgi:hypothetical protein